MKIEGLEEIYEPTLKEVVEMNQDLLITNDFEMKYRKTKLMYNFIYPLNTVLNRARYNISLNDSEKQLLKKMIDNEIDLFYRTQNIQ